MTNDLTQDPDEVDGIVRICTICGHAEDAHTEQEVEVGGNTLRRTFCRGCDDWHEPEFDA